jgi:hypothetical protein
MICESVRKKGSDERCKNKCLKNLKFCGKHIKIKSPILWKPKEIENISTIKIQKIWRGYMVRNYFKLCGPGIFKRSLCCNDEEIVTFESKESQCPFDFFSFEESGKIWWFSLDSSIKIFSQVLSPINPYTKVQLKISDRKRFRDLCDISYIRNGNKQKTDINEKINLIIQIMEENLFPDIDTLIFKNISKINLLIFTLNFHRNLTIWETESKLKTEIRLICIKIIDSCIKSQQNLITINRDFLLFQTLSALIFIMRHFKNKYPICFMIVSALYVL